MRDLILGLIILAALVWYFSGQPCGFPERADTGMYLLSGRGALATMPGNSGEEVDEPAPPIEPEPTEPTKPKPSDTQPQKSIDELAYECILGLWGNGKERKQRLTEAGHDYSAVQQRVNEILQ